MGTDPEVESEAAVRCRALLADGWREYPNQLKKHARCFYKRFDTPTPCAGNDNKPGMQIQIDVSEHDGQALMELELCAGLKDGTWLMILNYALPKAVEDVTVLVPRMLALWESAHRAGSEVPHGD